MDRAVLRLVEANSCVKVTMIVMVMAGFVIGVLSLIASFFGYDPSVQVIAWELHGIAAGVAAIFVAPFLGAFFSLFVGLLSCVALNLGLRFLHGIEVRGVWDANPTSLARRS